MKKCPFCAEQIQDEAIKCKHCGSELLAGRDVPVPRRANPIAAALILGAAGLVGVGLVSGMLQQGSREAPAAVPALESAAAQQLLEQAQQAGLLVKVDESLCYGYVDPLLWAQLDVDGKRGLAGALSQHFRARGDRGYAHIYDQMTGKRIATMTSFGQFSVK